MYNKRRFNVLVLFGVAQKFYCCRQSRNTTLVDWTCGEVSNYSKQPYILLSSLDFYRVSMNALMSCACGGQK